MYWSPQLLGRSFQKARNFTASSNQNIVFSIWVRGWYPRTLTAGECDSLPHPTRNSAFGVAPRRCWDPNLGPPRLFSRGCAPDNNISGTKLFNALFFSFLFFMFDMCVRLSWLYQLFNCTWNVSIFPLRVLSLRLRTHTICLWNFAYHSLTFSNNFIQLDLEI